MQDLGAQSGELLRLAVEKLYDYAFLTLSPDGHITSWNLGAEQIFGWRRDEAVCAHVSALLGLNASASGLTTTDLVDAARHGSTTGVRRLTRYNGSAMDATTTVHAVRQDGTVLGYAMVVQSAAVARIGGTGLRRPADATSGEQTAAVGTAEVTLPTAASNEPGQAPVHSDAADMALAGGPGEGPSCAASSRQRVQELHRAVVARDEFIATVAHELRNPISPLMFQVRLALDKTEEVAATGSAISTGWIHTQLRAVEQRLQRVLETLDRLLDVSRLSTGRIDLQLEPMELGVVVREVVESFDAELAAARCRLTLSERAVAAGTWDRLRVEQICRNLLSNAIRFGAGHPIEVTIDSDRDFASLAVRDHGIGIPPDQQARIFDRFEQGVERRSGGFGIGLWIVRNVCMAMGGSVSVESAIGAGAHFTVRLPRHRDRVAPAAPSASSDLA